jgi:hypothetical protein
MLPEVISTVELLGVAAISLYPIRGLFCSVKYWFGLTNFGLTNQKVRVISTQPMGLCSSDTIS